MQSKSINIYLNQNDYQLIMSSLPKGKLSKLVSSLLINYIRKEQTSLEEKASAGYQSYRKNSDLRNLAAQFEPISLHDIQTTLEQQEKLVTNHNREN